MGDSWEKIRTKKPHSIYKYKEIFDTWIKYLSNITLETFIYNGINFPSREIEKILQMTGFVGIAKVNNNVIPTYGSMSGVTDFPDIFTTYTYATPLHSGMLKINENCVIGDNNFNRMENWSDTELTAHLLTHIDLTIQVALINNRSNMLITAHNQADADTINGWYKSLANGSSLAITQKEDAYTLLNSKTVEVLDLFNRNNIDITQYYRLKDNLIKSFQSKWGLVGNQEKAERVINAELDTGLNRALYNIEDMLICRQKMCDSVNNMFGTKWSVKLNKQITEQRDNTEEISNDMDN